MEWQESLWARAYRDTKAALHSRVFLLGDLVISAGVGAALTEASSDIWLSVGVAMLGGAATFALLVVLWFVVNLPIAFAKQRNEARRQMMRDAEKHIPHNRDALVVAIHEFGKAASGLLLEYWVDEFHSEVMAEARAHGAKVADHGEAKAVAYRAAREKLELEERIAGADFERRIAVYRARVNLEIETWRYPTEPITEDDYNKGRKMIADGTEKTLRMLDDGGLYWPATPQRAPDKAGFPPQ